MSMFCFQCQEAAMGKGCTIRGVCGKAPETAKLQDLLVHTAKSIAYFSKKLRENGNTDSSVDYFLINSLFTTITNANFDDDMIIARIKEGLELRDKLWNLCKTKKKL